MNAHQLEEILQCLSSERQLFHYFKGRYALIILADVIGSGMKISEIKSTRYSGLLQKDAVKNAVRKIPDGFVTRQILESEWQNPVQVYRLTLGSWGGSESKHNRYYQTSRAGKNLVLQMNFSMSHNRRYHELIVPTGSHPFSRGCHPIASGSEQTLAWARIDLDMTTGEALIEEIQNDWIRNVLNLKSAMERIKNIEQREHFLARYIGGDRAYACRFQAYLDEVLSPHIDIWDEAMLAAAIWFLRSQIGIHTIYYHTFEGGNVLKELRWAQPPRSLYTTLPRRFCFRSVDRAPSFIVPRPGSRRGRRRTEMDAITPQFHLLEL